jgi:hypothetical protein
LDLGAELIGCGVCGGSCTGLSTLESCCPVQSQPLAYTGAVAVIARASTDPTITLIFDFMGITSFLRWKIASRSACGCDGHHRKDDRVSAPVTKPFFL